MGRISINRRMWVTLVRKLMERPWSVADLAREVGMTRTAVHWYVTDLRGLAYIKEWRRHTNGAISPQWAWGPGLPDAPRPKPKTAAQRQARKLPHGGVSVGIGIMAESRQAVR